MRAYTLKQIEANFDKNLIDSSGKKHQILPGIYSYTKRLDCGFDSHHYDEIKTKRGIVYHYTVGTLPSDIATLTTAGNKVSVPFVVARSGQIYELWDPKYWAYHLGPSKEKLYNNTEQSARMIGIEVSNMGPLVLKGSTLYDVYGKEYCLLTDQYEYHKISYRGYNYYAALTNEQYDSLRHLTADLMVRFGIPHTTIDSQHRFDFDPKNAITRGLTLHVNYRKDKFDFPPSFDFSRVGF